MKLLSVVGTRPHYIKIDTKLKQIIVNTGQHYDELMKDVFFKDLEIPKPKYDIDKTKLGDMVDELIPIMEYEQPDYVLIYGDTRSSIAGAIAAQQTNFKVIHIEAGCRSGNMKMAEERNRILIDKIATIHFCPSATAVKNLEREGITEIVFNVGAVQYDSLKKMCPTKNFLEDDYILMTLHRAENVDNIKRLKSIFANLSGNIILTAHPRLQKRITDFKIKIPKNVSIISPQSYKNMVSLMGHAKKIITDSGGVQVEAYLLRTPCITIRDETEWPETVEEGWNILTTPEKLKDKIKNFNKKKTDHQTYPYGNGGSMKKIRMIINNYL